MKKIHFYIGNYEGKNVINNKKLKNMKKENKKVAKLLQKKYLAHRRVIELCLESWSATT